MNRGSRTRAPNATFEIPYDMTLWKWSDEGKRHLGTCLRKLGDDYGQKSLSESFDDTIKHTVTDFKEFFKQIQSDGIRIPSASDERISAVYLWIGIRYPKYLDDFPRNYLPLNWIHVSQFFDEEGPTWEREKEASKISKNEVYDHSVCFDEMNDSDSANRGGHFSKNNNDRMKNDSSKTSHADNDVSFNFAAARDNMNNESFQFSFNGKIASYSIAAVIIGAAIIFLATNSGDSITTTGDCSPGSISGANSGIELNCD